MATSDKYFCSLCQNSGTSQNAARWCTECEVFLCKKCDKQHTKSRMIKNHTTMSTNKYKHLPALMQKISIQCQDHKMKFEHYCSFHACPCCVECTTDTHSKCLFMKPLSEILTQVKSSASVQLLEKDIKDLKVNIEEIIKTLKNRINTNNIQKTEAIEKIKSTRKNIDDNLNRLEKEILHDLEKTHSELESKMNTLLEKMTQQAFQIGQLQSEFPKLKKHATELQMYVGLREVEKTTSTAAKYLDDLEIGGHFNEKNLQVNISPALQSLLQNAKSFGDVNISSRSSTMHFNAGRKDQAQYLAPNVPEIKQIKPSFLRTMTIPGYMRNHDFYACPIFPDGTFLILDRTKNSLLLFDDARRVMRHVLTFNGYPQDACCVRNNIVAVTIGFEKKSVLVDLEKNKITEVITLSHYCGGIASDGQFLVISCLQKSTKVTLNDMSQTLLEGIRATNVSLFNEKIYCTVYNEDKVWCYSLTGEYLWKYQHPHIDHPKGLTLDMKGFVYISCYGNNSIVAVSPDGETSNIILSGADGIKYPVGIDISKISGTMILSSYTKETRKDELFQTAFVYQI